MATIQGVGGNVTFPTGFAGKFVSWSGNLENPEVDTTGFSDNGNAATENGGPVKFSGTAQAVGTFGVASSAPAPSTGLGASPSYGAWQGSATFTATTGCTIACTIIVSVVAMTRGANGRMDITFTFTSTGTITETWAQGGG
jgi:hypothetical protein